MLGLVWGYTDIYTVPFYVYGGWGKYRLEPTLAYSKTKRLFRCSRQYTWCLLTSLTTSSFYVIIQA